MEFSDDDDAAPPTEIESDVAPRPRTRRAMGAPPGRRRPPRKRGASRELLGRRLLAVGIGLIVLFGILLAFKGCLNARKERNYENYARDLEGIVTQSKQLSTEFFARLNDPAAKNLSELSFEAQVSSDRGTADNLLQRVQNLSTPGELTGAQSQLVLSFELRSDALADIASQLKSALAKSGSKKAVDAITNDMRSFLASDVLYARARDEIVAEFGNQGLSTVNGKPIDAVVPSDQFLPDLQQGTNWLDPAEVGTAIAAVAGGTGAATAGLHGVALVQTTLQPDGVILSPGTPVNATAGGSPGLEVQVANQGDSTEKGITVSVSGSGSDSARISTLAAGATGTAALSLDPGVAGSTVTVTVSVSPVNGEQLTDNNKATYQITFN